MSWEPEVIVGRDAEMPNAIVAVKNTTSERVRYVPERTCRNVNDVMKTGEIQFACSECGGIDDWARPNYCPHCGARVVS